MSDSNHEHNGEEGGPYGRLKINQPEEEVAVIRAGYQRLLGELNANKRELAQPENDRLTEMLGEATALLGRVGDTKVLSMDARFLAATAQLGAERIRLEEAGLGGCEFTLEQLLNLLREVLGRAAVSKDWRQLGGTEALRSWRAPRPASHLLGPLSPRLQQAAEQVPPRIVARRQRAPLAPLVEAKAMDEATIAEQREKLNETTHNVLLVHEALLSQTAPVALFRFIIHPGKFDRSVENLFYVAFLVANGLARVNQTGHDETTIMLEGLATPEEDPTTATKYQHIFTLTMAKWRQLTKHFALKRPMIDL